MTKVGLLLECGRDGLESIVCRRICDLLQADHNVKLDLRIATMDNKERLLEECGTVARNLFAEGCARVVILWDERPAWPDKHEPLCWHNDRMQVIAELNKAGVARDDVHLVCIEREFESWLLFDHKLLEAVLSTDAHRVRVAKQRRPDRHANPKSVMTTLFEQTRGKRYVDVVYAKQFATNLTTLNRLRKCETFQRFEARILGQV